MFDLWSIFTEGSSSDVGKTESESSSPAAPVSAFFDGLFKQPSQSDPSSWNDYTTGGSPGFFGVSRVCILGVYTATASRNTAIPWAEF